MRRDPLTTPHGSLFCFRPRFVRASNTSRILGWRWWKLAIHTGSVSETADPLRYRNGWIIYWGRHKVAFLPRTDWKCLEL